jgi:hypothetical protein
MSSETKIIARARHMGQSTLGSVANVTRIASFMIEVHVIERQSGRSAA